YARHVLKRFKNKQVERCEDEAMGMLAIARKKAQLTRNRSARRWCQTPSRRNPQSEIVKMAEGRPRGDPSEIARSSLAKMPDEERRRVMSLVQKAMDGRDLPKFRAALLKLGFSETSAEYEQLMRLWDEFARPHRD